MKAQPAATLVFWHLGLVIIVGLLLASCQPRLDTPARPTATVWPTPSGRVDAPATAVTAARAAIPVASAQAPTAPARLPTGGPPASPGAPVAANPVVVENQQAGSTEWQLGRTGFQTADDAAGQIKGYASATSVNKGEELILYVTVNPAQAFSVDVYRMGWYSGQGGRRMQRLGPLAGVQQPACPTESGTGLTDCAWSPSATLSVPETWTSGVYLAQLTNDQGYQNFVTFVVRDDARPADFLYQQSVMTYQAYNNYGGKSLYAFNSLGSDGVAGDSRAVRVSFDRPYQGAGAGDFLRWELPFVRWIERSGYDVTYSTDIDTHVAGQRLRRYRGFLSVGHDEYWSKQMYDAVQAARDDGVNLGFFGADAMQWQARLEPSASGVPNRVLVCYRDPALDGESELSLKTIQWRDPRLNRPEQNVIGISFTSGLRDLSHNAPYVVANSGHWVYGGTGLQDGDAIPGLVGYEADRDLPEYPHPPEAHLDYTILSMSPFTQADGRPDFANSSIYRAPSGAWVFAAGTISWSWGLDRAGVADPRIQRTTMNILNRFVRAVD